MKFDVLIVGGGPAGLSAALVLGRSCRKVLVVDAGNPRNLRSHGVHGFLTREGLRPAELLAMARDQLRPYNIECRDGTVMKIDRSDEGFHATLLDGSRSQSRKILLATGVVDLLPELEGIEDMYGLNVHHCPYCDGWEHHDGRIAVYGAGARGGGLALVMKTWSRDVVMCSDGPSQLTGRLRGSSSVTALRSMKRKISRLEGTLGRLERIVFEDGTSLPRTAMFFSTGNVQRSSLPESIGCKLTRKGAVQAGRDQRSYMSGHIRRRRRRRGHTICNGGCCRRRKGGDADQY